MSSNTITIKITQKHKTNIPSKGKKKVIKICKTNIPSKGKKKVIKIYKTKKQFKICNTKKKLKICNTKKRLKICNTKKRIKLRNTKKNIRICKSKHGKTHSKIIIDKNKITIKKSVLKINKLKSTKVTKSTEIHNDVFEDTIAELHLSRDDIGDIFLQIKGIGLSSTSRKVEKVEKVKKRKTKNTYHIEKKKPDNCMSCFSTTMFYDDGRLCCHSCGLIQGHQIQSSAEWRFYGSEDSKSTDPTRCGMPTNRLLPESSLGSIISSKFMGKYSSEFYRLRQYHQWNAMPYRERSLYNVFKNIHSKAYKAGIPSSIIEDAKSMYKVLNDTQISRGSNRRGLIASCIYIACKKKKVPRTANEIAAVFDIKPSEMTKGCKHFLEIMNMNKDAKKITIKASTSLDFINRFCSNLSLPKNIEKICDYVARKAEYYSIVDENTPPSVAAGSIYLVCHFMFNSITKKQVAKACKISEVTISKCYKKLYQYHSILFSKDILAKIKSK